MTHRPRNERFAFGDNWSKFVDAMSQGRILQAQASLSDMLGTDSLAGKTFLDVGSGSGLFSLAAMRIGASRVHSFDFDSASVQTTLAMKQRSFPSASHWQVERGDVLDGAYMDSLGTFDVVYAWGVLHHTGDMMTGLTNVARRVRHGGHLFVAIYNDQGCQSRIWKQIKRLYNGLPPRLRIPYVVVVMAPTELLALIRCLLTGRPRAYIERWTLYERARGMDRWHDMVDWVGGYPFEVARPEEVFGYFRERGFQLNRLVTRGSGCNEFVFERSVDEP